MEIYVYLPRTFHIANLRHIYVNIYMYMNVYVCAVGSVFTKLYASSYRCALNRTSKLVARKFEKAQMADAGRESFQI